MYRIAIFLISFALFLSAAHAIPTLSVESLSCSGTQTIAISDALSIRCSGDLSVLGGSISADAQILISSGGALTLDDLAMAAPDIQLVGDAVSLGAGVTITTHTLTANVSGGSHFPSVSPGSTISIGGDEPRPIVIGDILRPPGGRGPIGGGGPGG